MFLVKSIYLHVFTYLGFNVMLSTLLVILQWVVGKGRGNQYMQLVKVYSNLQTNSKQLTAIPHEVSQAGIQTLILGGGRRLCYHCATTRLEWFKQMCFNLIIKPIDDFVSRFMHSSHLLNLKYDKIYFVAIIKQLTEYESVLRM